MLFTEPGNISTEPYLKKKIIDSVLDMLSWKLCAETFVGCMYRSGVQR